MNILFLTSAAPETSGFRTGEKKPPLGLGILMALCKQTGHRVHFSDEYLKPSDILNGDFLERQGIDFVGIYSNTICYESTLRMFRQLQRKRERGEWSGRIAVGGPHTAVGWREIPDYVDHVVIGEGENVIIPLLAGFLRERVIHGTPVENLDSLPIPAWEEFIHRPYHWNHDWDTASPFYTMNTSRGCPYHCSFCSVGTVAGRNYRFMSAERIVADIEHMIRHYGARGIYFREDNFTFSKQRTIEFCEILLKKDIRIEWLCETRADTLCDPDLQRLMARAGCRVFYIGVESGSPRMLKLFRKGETVEQFVQAFDIAREFGIKTYASLIIGAPTETAEDQRMTDELLARIRPDFVGRNVFVGIPGSELHDLLRKDRLFEYEDSQHILYPHGCKEKIARYYGPDPCFDVYDPPSPFETFIEEYVRNQLGRFRKQYGSLLIYGAGKHTAWLLRVCGTRGIAGIVDDNAALSGHELHGVRIFTPAETGALQFSAVLVSSDTLQEALLAKARVAFDSSRPILPLYGDGFPNGPYPKLAVATEQVTA